MITINTWKNIQSKLSCLSFDLCTLVTSRFVQLHQLFCPDKLTPLEQFSLKDYGAIYVVESYSEVEGKTFEVVEKQQFGDTIVYFAEHLSNNEICSDYFIPAYILNPYEINEIEKEL